MGELYTGSETIGRDPRFRVLVAVCLESLDQSGDVRAVAEATKKTAQGLYPGTDRLADSMITAAVAAAQDLQEAVAPSTLGGSV